jgi:hypothetical protein
MGSGARSGGVAILVHKSTQDVDAVDPPNLGQTRRCQPAVGGGHAKVDAPMGTGGVVAPYGAGQAAVGVTRIPPNLMLTVDLGEAGGTPASGDR